MSRTIVALHEQKGIRPLIAKTSHRLWTVAALLCATVTIGSPAILSAAGKTIVVATHDVNFAAEWADRAGIGLRTLFAGKRRDRKPYGGIRTYVGDRG
ncbi:hypothetical protein [Cohnella hongkongensis]|uniref:Uncharacterized protein n=1 Tax=Cohnella hongkongensis TaxID=178337 RepID=A0ABV9FII0_9BACL